jgi:hypothetical protein
VALKGFRLTAGCPRKESSSLLGVDFRCTSLEFGTGGQWSIPDYLRDPYEINMT